MPILVTGCNGYIGKAFCKYYKEESHKKGDKIIGVDIVEINPMNDIGNGYSMAARTSSWILFEFISAIQESKR